MSLSGRCVVTSSAGMDFRSLPSLPLKVVLFSSLPITPFRRFWQLGESRWTIGSSFWNLVRKSSNNGLILLMNSISSWTFLDSTALLIDRYLSFLPIVLSPFGKSWKSFLSVPCIWSTPSTAGTSDSQWLSTWFKIISSSKPRDSSIFNKSSLLHELHLKK